MRTYWRSFLAALTLLTVFPVPFFSPDEDDISRTKAFFPLVGLLAGGLCFWLCFGLVFVMPPALLSMAAVIMLAAVSKGFHLDGLADCADGFLSSRPRERMLEIMRDSHIGVMGVLAVFTVLGMKFASFVSLAAENLPGVVLLCAVAGRCGMVIYIQLSNYAREEGLGKLMFKRKSWGCAAWNLVMMCVTGWFLFGIYGLIAALTAALFAAAWALYTRVKIGGATGDCIGACEEIIECLVAMIFACLS